MIHSDSVLLEKAYLSIAQKMPSVPSDSDVVGTQANDVVSAGPVDEPAPGVDMSMADRGAEQQPLSPDISAEPPMDLSVSSIESEDRLDVEDENEEDSMSIDNLNSIRESIMKIAKYCAQGGHMEPWQQQKLAISMDNLAEIARSVRC